MARFTHPCSDSHGGSTESEPRGCLSTCSLHGMDIHRGSGRDHVPRRHEYGLHGGRDCDLRSTIATSARIRQQVVLWFMVCIVSDSKCILEQEETHLILSIALVFSLKGIVIMLYRKLLVERWQRIVLYITTCICVAGFTGITLAISLICLPLHKRWQVYPPPPPTCTASSSVLISLACINAFTDVLAGRSPGSSEKDRADQPL